ncbi:O-antigen ligase family protein [Evansella tamaricis]|uniref:O-antigen ligase family protein n=1 Tax=Evansella tamaricis TaxID=2069301 RepID=A0ABS6JEY3_9BACI|nr:O-antigen ligase family protein [Evansella tamaricis]MBU9712166.1 O-antigen ligase family protein [Evansella tamaricis]
MKIIINNKSIYSSVFYLMIIFSFISYEYTLYTNAYQILLLIVFSFGLLMVLLGILSGPDITDVYLISLKNNLLVHLLSLLLILSIFVSSLKLDLVTTNGVINVIISILSIYVFFLLIPTMISENKDRLIVFIISLITFFSVIGIIIGLRGEFLGYTYTHYNRVSSIFFDPNYFGTLCAMGFILSIHKKGKYKFFAVLNLVALFYTGSRAAMIGLLIVTVLFYFYKKRVSINSFLFFLFICFLTYYFIGFLEERMFFRTFQGLSSREYLWDISFHLIKNEPLWGYGYGTVGSLLHSHGASNVSSHNAYLDYIMTNGIIPFVIYSLVIVKSVYMGYKTEIPQSIIKCIVLILINANSISINLGGIGITSLLFTLFLGICNFSGNESKLKQRQISDAVKLNEVLPNEKNSIG